MIMVVKAIPKDEVELLGDFPYCFDTHHTCEQLTVYQSPIQATIPMISPNFSLNWFLDEYHVTAAEQFDIQQVEPPPWFPIVCSHLQY